MPVRNAQPKDAAAIERLLTQLGHPVTSDLLEKRLHEMSHMPSETLIVYEDENGNVSGFMSIHIMPRIALAGDFMQIVYFAVDETARSKGIGRQMEAYAEGLARKKNCAAIFLHCNADRKDAHRFYERQGYLESPKYFIKRLS
jgi:GNAT superfamily N-acetyltransferase